MIHVARRSILAGAALALLVPRLALAAGSAREAETIGTDDGRRVAISRWRPRRRLGTMMFSHGALSAPWKYGPLIEPLVAAGWEVWAPLHVDSTDHPDTARYPGLASWPARIHDMRALARHVGASSYVAAGHSYGALVALTLGGASPTAPAGVKGPLADPRVAAVVAFSPPGPGMGLIDAAGYATLAVPALVETGTADVPPGVLAAGGWHQHLAAWDAAAPGGDRYALVLDGADHYFGGLICRPELPGPRQRAQLDLAIDRSLAFLRGYGGVERDARRALALAASAGPAAAPGFYRH